MIQGTLNSPVSAEVRSISTFLLILAPAIGLLAYSNWPLHGSYGKQRANAAAVQLSDRLMPASTPAIRVRSWNHLGAYPYSQRAAFIAGMRALLSEFDRRHSASGDSPQSVTLREAESRMRAELDSLELATSPTWETAKQEVGVAWRSLQAVGGDAVQSDPM